MKNWCIAAAIFCLSVLVYVPTTCNGEQEPATAEMTSGQDQRNADEETTDNNINLQQSKLMKYLYSLALNKVDNQFREELSQNDPNLNSRLYLSPKWFLEDNSYWAKYNNLKKRAPCLLNAGLSHGCDMMDFYAAKHQQSKFADFAGPGK